MAFLIPCTEMRSTDSSWSQSQQQEEEEKEVTRDSEACASTGPLSPPPHDPTPPFQTPTQPAPPVVETENIRTHRPKRRRPDRQEDRLIACLDALAHPAPKLSSDALFLLSLEEKMQQQVPRSRITEARDTLTRALDSFIPHYDITQPNNAPQHPPTTHTYTSQTYPQTNIPHPHDTCLSSLPRAILSQDAETVMALVADSSATESAAPVRSGRSTPPVEATPTPTELSPLMFEDEDTELTFWGRLFRRLNCS
ncbi:uncharacterized protein LOC122939288 [Bufo gargarizans]|uniref:uncharacterized protein LOC122939288 n=1 Tax=Bufo gargarizans TaxID=30331 RepID=UPI001CF50DB0|nr:uncharacterized protein LOC122939288 [Bufo gargarizans]